MRERRDEQAIEPAEAANLEEGTGNSNQAAAARLLGIWSRQAQVDANDALDDDAAHDGSKTRPLGAGDQVFDARGNVIPAFAATPDGVCQAALYELHRGARRSMAEILADQTLARTERGPDAAVEVGKNRDGGNAPVIGRRNGRPTRPIAAYMAATGLAGAYEWCGGFVSFVYERAGIDIGSLSYTLNIDDETAQDRDVVDGRALNGQYFRVDGGGRRRPGGGFVYEGNQQRGLPSERLPRYENAPTRDAGGVDVRPGDCFWLEYSGKQGGHAGVIIGVEYGDRFINLVTIEGNYGQKLKSNVRRIEVQPGGRLSSTVKGWARPAELAGFPPPERGLTQQWVRARVRSAVPGEDTTSIYAGGLNIPEETTS